MKTQQVYNFFFHPMAHPKPEIKVLSTITIVALSLLTVGGFLIAFGIINWRDRHIVQQNPQKSKTAQVAIPKIKVEAIKTNSEAKMSVKAKDVKEANLQQVKLFEAWAAQGDWKRFRPEYSHYDWWAFPVSRPSAGHGDKYAINSADIESLKADEQFVRSYRRGVELVVKSWGWDLSLEAPVPDSVRTADQMWTGYGVRLGKMADSLKLFGEQDLYQRVQKFYDQMVAVHPQQLEAWVSKTLER